MIAETTTTQRFHPPRLRSFLLASFVAGLSLLLLLAVLWQYKREHEHSHMTNNKALASGELMALRSSIESSLYRRLNLPVALKAFVESNPGFSQAEFDRFASSLMETVPGIMSLQLAPDAIVTYLTNAEANRKALGHDLLGDPARRPAVLRAIEEKRFIVAGPLDLIQGGRALIARLPIFIDGHESRTEFEGFWGFATVLIDVDALYSSAGFGEINQNIDIAIRGKDGLGADGDLFYGDPAVFENALGTIDVALPNGSWQIASALNADRLAHGHPLFTALALGLSLFLAIFVWALVYRQGSRELLKAKNEAERASQLKSDFIAVMSHEMRTPLNGVLGILDLLGNSPLSAQQSDYIKIARESGEHLLRHINDVLDIERIESGKTEIACERLDIDALVAGIVEIARPGAEERGTVIEHSIDVSARPLCGDAHRIRQVLLNIVGNAVKFTPEGRISVAVRTLAETTYGAELEFSVTDTGAGIDPDDLARVFEDFVRLDASYDRETGGSGLGLAISRRIVHAMGGEIGVTSTAGQGSRFWVRLPLAAASPAATADAVPSAEHPAAAASRPASLPENGALDILLVEDNATNRLVAREMLTLGGHTVTEAKDGAEGVELAGRKAFDLILMDISMPIVDGVEATRLIRASNGPCRDVPIIGLTAHAMEEERQRFLAAGMRACLTKPIRQGALYSALGLAAAPDAESGVPGGGATETLIDRGVLDEMAQLLSPQAMSRTIRMVCEEIDAELPQILALQDADAELLGQRVHKLAGSVALIGAKGLGQLLREIETSVKCGRLAEASEAIARLPESARQTRSVLRQFESAAA